MLQVILLTVFELLVRLIIGSSLVILLYHFSNTFFGISIKKELQRENRAATMIFVGICLFVGLIVGLAQI